MSSLLSRSSAPDTRGRIQQITPQSAGWHYVGFEAYQLGDNAVLTDQTAGRECCLVIVAGRATVSSGSECWKNIGERSSAFEDLPPYAVYLPPGRDFTVRAHGDLELAVCWAPAEGRYPARLITPAQCQQEARGSGSNQRKVCNILFGNLEAERLLVVEVITPDGNWSSYPPHKHDTDAAPAETSLEETYYHKLSPPQGFAFQRVYTDDRSLDETMTVQDHDVVMVPRGYHPVGTPYGYQLYYLNVMAGPERRWIFRNDPSHEWILAKK